MNRKITSTIIIMVLFLLICVVIIVVPFSVPFHSKVKFKTEDESKLKITIKFDKYSNDIAEDNIVNITLKLVRKNEQTLNINITKAYLHTFLFFENNVTLNSLLDEENDTSDFQIAFTYSLTWKKVDLSVRIEYSSNLINGTSITENTGYLVMLNLLPNPNYRQLRNGLIGGIPLIILAYVGYVKIKKRRVIQH